MWTLFVITLMPEIDDARYLRYKSFDNLLECIIEQAELQNDIGQNALVSLLCTKEE